MATPSSTTEFLDLVRKSGIYRTESLDDRLSGVPNLPGDPVQSAAVLVQHGLLTRFQAKLLLTGRYKGFRLGPYVIKEQLGQGGMGAVYLAEHETLRRRVALKVLTPPKDDANGRLTVERFLREARAAAALDHPNIVRIHDVAQQADVHYLVMEYVEGQTLDRLLDRGGPVAPSRAVGYIAQAAAGLQHAHDKGFVHRDIKPANLIAAKDGTVKILDMGLARSFTAEGDKLTEVMDQGAILGTADFIAPEQAMNAPHIDIRADIYSLGATFFALVTGKPPFAGNTTQKLIQHQMKEAPDLTTLDRTFPPELARVVAKMLAKKPEKRYQTPAEVITALAPWLSDEGGTKVVAGLSGTDLSGSGALQNTLNEIVGGGTQRIGSRRLAGGRPPGGNKALWAGVAAAVLLAVGLVGYVAFGGRGKDPAGVDPRYVTTGQAAPQPGGPQAQPQQRPAAPAQRPAAGGTRPVSAAFTRPVARTVYKLDPGRIPACQVTMRGFDMKTGEKPALPPGVSFHCWKSDSIGEFTRTTLNGRPVFGLANRENDPSAQLALDITGEIGAKLASDVDYGFRVEYMTTGGTTGYVAIQDKTQDWKELSQANLPDTGGAWQSVSGTFRREKDGAVQFAVNATATNSAGMIYVRTMEVIDSPGAAPARAPGRVLYALDLSRQQVFTDRGRKPRSGEGDGRWQSEEKIGSGVVPAGWLAFPWADDTVAEFAAQSHGGRMALGMRTTAGQSSAMLFAPEFTAPEGRAWLKVEYRCEAASGGLLVRFMGKRPQEKPAWDVRTLPAGDGEWQTAEFEVDLRGSTGGLFEFHNSRVGQGQWVWIRAVTVSDSTAAGAAGAPPAFRADFAALQPDTEVVRGRSRHSDRLGAQTLPPGVGLNHFDTTTDADYTIADVGGARALGLRNVNGAGLAQIMVDPKDLFTQIPPGETVTYRIEYRCEGAGTGHANVQLNKQPWTKSENLDLDPTGGAWKSAEVKFVRPDENPYSLTINIGGTATLWVRSVEAWIGAPPAAPGEAGAGGVVYRLDLSGQKPFRKKGGVRHKDPTPVDVEFLQREKTGDGDIPPGWVACPHDREAEFLAEVHNGSMALGIRHVPVGGNPSGMLFTPDLDLPAGRAVVRFEYMTDGGVPAVFKFKQSRPTIRQAWHIGPDTNDGRTLPATNGQWQTVETEVDLQGATGGYFEFHNSDRDPAKGFWLRALEVRSPGGAGEKVLFEIDPAKIAPFKAVKQGHEVLSGTEPGFPWGYMAGWKKETKGEFGCGPVDGQPALWITHRAGPTSCQLGVELEDPGRADVRLTRGKQYGLRVAYKTAGGAKGAVYVQTAGDYKSVAHADLPPTDGGWQTVTLQFTKEVDQPVRFLVDNWTDTDGSTVYVRKVELVEPGAGAAAAPAAPAREAARTVLAFDAAAMRPGRFTIENRQITGANFFADGFFALCWKPESVAEFRCQDVGGARAFGVTNLNDVLSGQIIYNLERRGVESLTAGTEYRVRVEYTTANDGEGKLVAREPSPTFRGLAEVALTRGGDGWRTAEFVFRRPADKPIELLFENTAVGEGNTVWVRKFEVQELK